MVPIRYALNEAFIMTDILQVQVCYDIKKTPHKNIMGVWDSGMSPYLNFEAENSKNCGPLQKFLLKKLII